MDSFMFNFKVNVNGHVENRFCELLDPCDIAIISNELTNSLKDFLDSFSAIIVKPLSSIICDGVQSSLPIRIFGSFIFNDIEISIKCFVHFFRSKKDEKDLQGGISYTLRLESDKEPFYSVARINKPNINDLFESLLREMEVEYEGYLKRVQIIESANYKKKTSFHFG